MRALLVCLLVATIISFFLGVPQKFMKAIIPNDVDRVLEVSFPLFLLSEEPRLLEPNNTETVFEYYLLENLACGLIRDSNNSAVGYEGCLAEKFYQKNPTTWVFELRKATWSDGSEVTESEIIEWINGLRNENKRHIKYLRLATTVNYDHKSRNLSIQFPFPVDSSLLHELSLADSGLLPTDFRISGWGKTSGPYSVKLWDKRRNILTLVANPYSSLFDAKMPQTLNLWWLSDHNKRDQLFKSVKVDVVMVPSITSLPKTNELIANAPQVFSSYPTTIGSFYFNHSNLDAVPLENRKKFAFVIADMRKIIDTSLAGQIGTHQSADQLIPEGFSGRLPTSPVVEVSPKGDALSRIKLRMPTAFSQWNNFEAELIKLFKTHGITVELEFEDFKALDNEVFASLYFFQGNQANASGSWSFLVSEPHGKLSSWLPYFEDKYEAAFDFRSLDSQFENFQKLHWEVLESAFAVPVMVGQVRYLMSDRVDFSKWNKFDSRMRFYQLSWK